MQSLRYLHDTVLACIHSTILYTLLYVCVRHARLHRFVKLLHAKNALTCLKHVLYFVIYLNIGLEELCVSIYIHIYCIWCRSHVFYRYLLLLPSAPSPPSSLSCAGHVGAQVRVLVRGQGRGGNDGMMAITMVTIIYMYMYSKLNNNITTNIFYNICMPMLVADVYIYDYHLVVRHINISCLTDTIFS